MRGLLSALLLTSTGCASFATGLVADALSGSGGSFGRDEDPELVAAAVPFGLKTMESVLLEKPEHVGLLTALASGFTQYAYAFVAQDIDELKKTDLDRAYAVTARAKKLYVRALSYGLRGLDAKHEGFSGLLRKDPDAALSWLEPEDVPLMYWTAAAWGLAISCAKNEPGLLADFPLVEKLANRALALDESYAKGSIHDLFITLETSRPGGSVERATQHFDRSIALSGGLRASTYVSMAESVTVKTQDAKAFRTYLEKALAVDLNQSPEDRLANEISQRRARRLLANIEDLFLDEGE